MRFNLLIVAGIVSAMKLIRRDIGRDNSANQQI